MGVSAFATRPRILLVNPPVYDFAAYDFWLKPYGLLRVGGMLRGAADLRLFDFLDRHHALVPPDGKRRADEWGRGQFYAIEVPKPAVFERIPRRYHRFGVPREAFRKFLVDEAPFDAALVQTGMTYWYPGVQEVIADLRARCPQTKIVLGGVYASLCFEHARGLGADLVVNGAELTPLWEMLGLAPDEDAVPSWDLYPRLDAGVLKLTDGCPFRCTYCAVPRLSPRFAPRPLERVLAEFDCLCRHGAANIAFYDDALLHESERVLEPFLRAVVKRGARVNFHTPNAINARFVTRDLARLMVEAGFKVIYLGFESRQEEWHAQTGGKVTSDELARAVEHFAAAGADMRLLHAYMVLGHPLATEQQVEASMRFAHELGLSLMLAEFSPLPGTPDGERCREWVDLDEPLWHSKTAFPIVRLGAEGVNRLKQACRSLNQDLCGGIPVKL